MAPRWRAVAFVSVVAGFVAILTWQTTRIVLAQTWGESHDPQAVERAIKLDPSNPELYYNLGLLRLSSGDPDPAEAIQLLRKAAELNPHQSRYWSGLARGCFLSGDLACANQAFERAVQLAPMKPSLEWEAGTYYVATARSDKAVAHFQRFLQLSPEESDQVFRLTDRAFDDPAMVWQSLIARSSDPRVKCAYLDFLGEKSQFDLAIQYWEETVRTTQALSFVEVKPFLARLLFAKQYGQAAMVWRDLLRLGVLSRSPSQASGNLVFNGEFDQPILNAGFDWQINPEEYVAVDFADKGSHGGNSLRVDFTAPHNADDEPAYQLVPVAPNSRYKLTANVRSEEIISDSGPRLRVVDPKCSDCLSTATEGVTGTTDWHPVTSNFVTGPQTEVVRISIWRPRSRSFPMDITGRFWADSVKLTLTGAALPAPAQVADAQ